MSPFTSVNQPQAAPDPRTTCLRRPTTTDSTAFWYCSEERWNEMVSDTAASEKNKLAMNNLRKFDTAGRIMETEEGVLAVVPCSWCAREGGGPCMLFPDGGQCAYCRRHAKGGCKASLEPAPVSVEDRLAMVEARLADLEAQSKKEFDDVNGWIQWLYKRTSTYDHVIGCICKGFERVWQSVFPGEESAVSEESFNVAIETPFN